MIDREYIERMRRRVSEIESELAAPALAANQKRYRELMGDHMRSRDLIARADVLFRLQDQATENRALIDDASTDPELRAMAQADLADLEKRLPIAEKEALYALLPPDPADHRSIIMEIRAGTGGDEAALFAADLFRMYSKYAITRGWKISVIDASASPVGGYKEIVYSVEGQNVYRALRYESGAHRVQRVPVTEQQGRIHTSAATVAVLPEAEEIDEIEIKTEDLRIDLYRASGPGGQKVNKTESAVRLTHLPSGMVVQSQDERSQQRNRDRAMRVLKARLLDHYRAQDAAKTADDRRSQIGSGDRSERIRTYNFPQNRMTDHRINLTLYQLDRVIEGDMDTLIQALQEHDLQAQLKAHMDAATGAA